MAGSVREVEGVGDGVRVVEGLDDEADRLIETFEDVEVVEPQDEPSVVLEPAIPDTVPCGVVVAVAVDFDDQAMCATREVHDVQADGILTTETHTENGPSQFVP